METTINKSALFKMAYSILNNNQVNNFSDALKAAWKAMKIKAQLAAGVVRFAYRKTDGTIRKAIGTMKAYASNVTSSRKSCGYTVVYYDIERKALRSFRAVSLI